MNNIIADRAHKIDASGIRKAFALAATLENPINFSIGQPDFDVPDQIKQEAVKAIIDGYNKYSQTAGHEDLISKISGQINDEFGWKKPGVIVTSGVSGGLLITFLATLNPGDEVIIPDPYFVIYKHVINMLDAKCVFIDTYPDFKLPVNKIDEAITEKTKLIIINSPCNPTGAVYSHQELKELAELARKNDILVMTDEIYQSFSYDEKCPSIADYYEKTILLRGFGKTFAMTGWRLGYVVAHESMCDLIDQMAKIQQYTFVCAPGPLQKAVASAIDYDVSSYIDSYRHKRDLIFDGLRDKYELVRPCGAFYAFIQAPNGLTGTEFSKKAIANNVIVIPGNVFSERDTHFRISYATSDEKIRRGIEILHKLV